VTGLNANHELKKNKIVNLIMKNQRLFQCPVCNGPMEIRSYSLFCENNHCFDLSRHGYINLLTRNSNEKYSKDLFQARHKISEKGFFDPLIDEFIQVLKEYQGSSDTKELAVLDAGCGEGSHISRISRLMNGESELRLIGTDIAKEGIKIAAKANNDIIWIVSDLSRLPFQNNSFHTVLNILSPANYSEFERILKKDGMIIKIVPAQFYLKEIRERIDKGRDYSNDRIVDYFSNKLKVLSRKNIHFQYPVDEDTLPFLFKMTPLTWGISFEEWKDHTKTDLPFVTVDLTMLVGKKRA